MGTDRPTAPPAAPEPDDNPVTTPSGFCAACAHADRHGWWGQEGTHCRDCHTSWRSTSQQHCVGCHRQFGSEGALAWHQQRGTGCVDPATIVAKDGTARLVARKRKGTSVPVWVRNAPEALRSLRRRAS